MNRLVLIAFALLFLLLGGMGVYIKHLENKLVKAEDYKSLYNVSVQKNKIWQDQAGYWRNKAEASQAGTSTLKDLEKKNDPSIAIIRKDFKAVHKSFNNLESFNQVETETKSEIKIPVKDTTIKVLKGKDTIKIQEKEIKYHNDWNTYDITIIGDSADIKREGKEELEEAVYWERVTKKGNKTLWPFGKKSWSSEIISKNPETKIIKQSLLIVRKKK